MWLLASHIYERLTDVSYSMHNTLLQSQTYRRKINQCFPCVSSFLRNVSNHRYPSSSSKKTARADVIAALRSISNRISSSASGGGIIATAATMEVVYAISCRKWSAPPRQIVRNPPLYFVLHLIDFSPPAMLSFGSPRPLGCSTPGPA